MKTDLLFLQTSRGQRVIGVTTSISCGSNVSDLAGVVATVSSVSGGATTRKTGAASLIEHANGRQNFALAG